MRLLLLLPLLVGCSQSDATRLQKTLDEYASLSAQASQLGSVLTGDALASAQKSEELLENLGITQIGRAKFVVLAAAEGEGEGCLDLSGVELLNAKGERIIPSRPDRVAFEASYEANFLVSSLVITEELC
jgi:hypothetical protein